MVLEGFHLEEIAACVLPITTAGGFTMLPGKKILSLSNREKI